MTKKLLIILLVVVVAGGAVIGGIFAWRYWQASKQEEKPEVEVPADWKTYRNEEYGYEFKYPKDYTVIDTKGTPAEKRKSVKIESPKIYPHPLIKNEKISLPIVILVGTEESHGSSIEEIKERLSGNTWGKEEIVYIDGKKGIRLNDFNNTSHRTYIPYKKEVYELINSITIYEDHNEVYNQMLSTFKFIE